VCSGLRTHELMRHELVRTSGSPGLCSANSLMGGAPLEEPPRPSIAKTERPHVLNCAAYAPAVQAGGHVPSPGLISVWAGFFAANRPDKAGLKAVITESFAEYDSRARSLISLALDRGRVWNEGPNLRGRRALMHPGSLPFTAVK
jgi:hypothetical protein